jgi:hypothetical protein
VTEHAGSLDPNEVQQDPDSLTFGQASQLFVDL